jgi:hypothetical protein
VFRFGELAGIMLGFMNKLKPYRMQVYVSGLPEAARINQAVVAEYTGLRDDPGLQRSHLFAGRYENVYVPEARLPAIQPVLAEARRAAAEYLQRPNISLSMGFWFNEMGPGHVTMPHSHDDDDELVSGVYYVRVPQNSGELVLTQGCLVTRVTPVEGQFVFFPPDVIHEVTENRSLETRLSVGMNFGIRK